MKKSLGLHWDNAYLTQKPEELGWYEAYSGPSMELIEMCKLPHTSIILNVGALNFTMLFFKTMKPDFPCLINTEYTVSNRRLV